MRITKTLRAVMAALLTLVLCARGLPSASAAGGTFEEVKGKKCSLTVEFAPEGEPMPGVKFEIWRVGELTDQGWKLLDKYPYSVRLDNTGAAQWDAAAGTLLGYLRLDNIPSDAAAVTDSQGLAKFTDLDAGLYLAAGESGLRNGSRYTPTPFLVSLPNRDAAGIWYTDVTATCKFTIAPPEPVDRHVLKTWNDGGNAAARPQQVEVVLLRNGQPYDTVTLTAANNWRHDWTNLDPNSDWTVVEKNPGQYSVIVERTGITFQIINTWSPPPYNPPPENPPPDNPPPDNPPPDNPPPDNPPPPDTFDRTDNSNDPPPVPDTPVPPNDPPPDLTDITDGQTPLDTTTIPDGDTPLDTTDIPDDGTPLGGLKLPQTGQLWWPVAPMALGGLALIAVGWKRRRDWSGSDDA